MFLRSRKVPCCSFAVSLRSTARKTNARSSRMQPVPFEARRDRARRVALLDDEFDLRRVARGRVGQRRTEVLADDVAHERHREGGGVVGGPAQDRAVDERAAGRSARRAGRRPPRTIANTRNLTIPTTPLPDPPRPLRPPPTGGLDHRRQDVGRVGVGVVGMRLRGAVIPWASAGADRHAWFSVWSLGRGRDERIPARVSSSSCRMMAAASRSTRAR